MDIVKFKNNYTTHPFSGDVQEHNFIEFPMDKKTFTIYKDGITFCMLCHQNLNFKLENFEKCLIKVTKLDCQGFVNMYHNLLLLCIDNGIFLLPFHSFDPDCTKPMGFICADPFEDPCSQFILSMHTFYPLGVIIY